MAEAKKKNKVEGDWTQTAWFLVGLVTLRQPAGFKEAFALFLFSFANKLWGVFERVKKIQATDCVIRHFGRLSVFVSINV